jgi:hypothetical protein
LKKDKKLVKKVRAKNKPEDEQGVESPREILVSTDGTQLSSLQGLECGNKTKDYERLNPENKELKEALVQRDRESFSTADLLSKREIEFMIPTEQFNEIHRVMENCNDFCYLTFDVKDKMFLCAESDTSRRRIKEIVTD